MTRYISADVKGPFFNVDTTNNRSSYDLPALVKKTRTVS